MRGDRGDRGDREDREDGPEGRSVAAGLWSASLRAKRKTKRPRVAPGPLIISSFVVSFVVQTNQGYVGKLLLFE